MVKKNVISENEIICPICGKKGVLYSFNDGSGLVTHKKVCYIKN